jgi:uncharacterized protein (UPF0210 family)
MKIRSVTGFIDPGWPMDATSIQGLASCLKACKGAFVDAGFDVQTLRIATPPPSEMGSPVSPGDRIEFAQNIEAEIFVSGVDYAAVGPATLDDPDGYPVIQEMLASTENIFTSGIFAEADLGLSPRAALACAKVIQSLSGVTADGFTNLRFAAIANVPAGVPFFPASYHRSGPVTIAVATEAADLAVAAVQEAKTVRGVRRRIVQMIEDTSSSISSLASRITHEFGFRFHGIDFSLAPFPSALRSIGTALEGFGLQGAGAFGTITAAAFLADCLEDAAFERAGFCGLFLPVLEDSVLAERSAEGYLTITDLLLYSTLCGTGLDTLPLPGDVSVETITALLMDLGALSLRHDKPLTARLMPIPGKRAGERVHFDFPYFADSRVMEIRSTRVSRFLTGDEFIQFGPHT